jgi:hypothetical protein
MLSTTRVFERFVESFITCEELLRAFDTSIDLVVERILLE